MTKEGYQPTKTTVKPIPPDTGSNVHMKEDGYTWKDLDKSYWEGFDNAKNKMEKRIEELETRCTELFLQNNEFAERFEKSIEIIKGLLSCCRNYPQENAKKIEQAKQFLKEIKEND